MKKALTVTMLVFSITTFAKPKAMVVVLEAPLYQSPSEEASVLQILRRGQVIYLHGREFSGYEKDQGFFKTVTRDGSDAYIPIKFVKVVHNNLNELDEPMIALNNDPTDYRLEEPLPRNYPIASEKSLLASFNFHYGSSFKQHYQHNLKLNKENFSSQFGLTGFYAKKANFDKTNRFYFGFEGGILSQESEFLLSDNRYVKESHTEINFGPVLNYDFYRNEKYSWGIRGGLKVGYNRHLVRQDGDLGEEERLFHGISFSSNIGTILQLKKLLPSDQYFVSVGADVSMKFPFTMTTSTEAQIPSYWNETNDTIAVDLTTNFSMFAGVIGNF
ncbi:hypothetical protein M899_1359 [Bacteriovorax sp. BSW11_IV]|uniref:hypothetical protein n=1 Tax=Bacteriovorax sp. BSW11_IV TaxID=1353529 RepID=UPI00038A33B6|nr:hypothetical protein [Bacteriovorax sp. BSW11_IV]EQC45741.1 hypothetical protein M899_1359 [Bacteriovorax sp. BSW11_IV]